MSGWEIALAAAEVTVGLVSLIDSYNRDSGGVAWSSDQISYPGQFPNDFFVGDTTSGQAAVVMYRLEGQSIFGVEPQDYAWFAQFNVVGVFSNNSDQLVPMRNDSMGEVLAKNRYMASVYVDCDDHNIRDSSPLRVNFAVSRLGHVGGDAWYPMIGFHCDLRVWLWDTLKVDVGVQLWVDSFGNVTAYDPKWRLQPENAEWRDVSQCGFFLEITDEYFGPALDFSS